MKLLAYYKLDLAKYLVIRENCDKFLGVKSVTDGLTW